MREETEWLKDFVHVTKQIMEKKNAQVVQEVFNEMKMTIDIDKALPLSEKKDFLESFISRVLIYELNFLSKQ